MDKYESTKANFNKTCVIETSITSICTYKCWYCHWVELKDKYYSFSKRYIRSRRTDYYFKNRRQRIVLLLY